MTDSARYPSAREMLAMRNAALMNSHPSLLLGFTLAETMGWPSGEQPSRCVAPADTANRLASLRAAVRAPFSMPLHATG